MTNNRRRELLGVVVGFSVLTLIATMPLVVHLRRALPSDLLDTLLNAWIVGWDADRLRHGLSRVWDAPIFFPYHNTLAFSENLFGVAVLLAPVYWATHNAVLTYNVAFLVSFVLAGVGMYLLATELTGSRHAGWVAGVFYAFGPYRFAQLHHLQMIATGWMPIALFALHRYLATRRWTWLVPFAGAYVLQATSNSYVAYFLLAPVACVAGERVWSCRTSRRPIVFGMLAAALAMAVVLSPVMYRYVIARAELGQVRNAHEVETFSADLRSYVVVKNTVGLWRWLPSAEANDTEKQLFPGVLPLVLGLIAVVAAARHNREDADRIVWVYLAIGGIAVLLSLGPIIHVWDRPITSYGPYGFFYRLIPGWGGMRVPARFAVVATLALAVLAAAGTRSLLQGRSRPVQNAATVILAALMFAEGFSAPIPIHPYSSRGLPVERLVAEWLSPRPDGAILFLPVRSEDYEELNRQFVTLAHGHPIVSAYSGWHSPLQRWFQDHGSPLYDMERFPAVVRMLRAIGIRYVIVERDGEASGNALRGAADALRASGQIVSEEQLPGADAFELQDLSANPREGGDVEVPPDAFTISVDRAADRAANLTDGDPDTRWFADQDGSPWIASTFKVPQNITRVELLMASRSVADYPRALRIESTDAAGSNHVLYDAVPYPELAVGFVRNAEYPAIVIPLPTNETRTLRIRATAAAGRWWSVHELRFWRRDQG